MTAEYVIIKFQFRARPPPLFNSFPLVFKSLGSLERRQRYTASEYGMSATRPPML